METSPASTALGQFDWNRTRAFLAAAKAGSFSGAARALGVAQPTIGRQVAALEEELGVTLFERVGQGLSLTSPGVELFEQAQAMGEAANRIARIAAGQSTALEGIVRVTASEAISAYLLPPIVAELRSTYPGIELELVVSNAVQNLREREADIAVRSFRPQDAELTATRINNGVARLYASPSYLAQFDAPITLETVNRMEIFGFDRTPLMIEGLRSLGLELTPRNFPVVTSNHLVQWELAKRGLGVCVMMEEVGDPEPAVVRVLDEIPPLPVSMWVTCHRELGTSRRLRVVFDALVDGLRKATSGG